MADTERAFIATFSYNTALFDPATITRLLQHFALLLETLCESPGQRLSELSLVDHRGSASLDGDLVAIAAAAPPFASVTAVFEAQAARTPEALAVVLDDGQLTYRELNRRANQLARHLRSLGVRAEVSVALCAAHSIETIIALLAILKAGGVYVPLDPAHPRERLAFIMEDAGVSVLLTESALLADLPRHEARVICLDEPAGAIGGESDRTYPRASGPTVRRT